MQLVERHIIKKNKSIEDICFKSARLYNFCNYHKRQAHFGRLEKFSEYELSKLLAEFNQEDYRELSTQTSQQIIKLLFKNWKGYYATLKSYKKNPSLFTGRPKPPKYKDKEGYSVCVFTNQQVKLRDRYIYRNNFIEDKLHKFSRFIINYCIKYKIGTIVIGKNKGWKDSISIGSKNNQNFCCIPHAKFINKLKYKAQLASIEVIEHEESYTPKTDHLALEEMKHHETYLGKRKHRGLFQSSTGKLINADINGAIGIARKVFGDSVVEQIINSGFAFNPVRLNII